MKCFRSNPEMDWMIQNHRSDLKVSLSALNAAMLDPGPATLKTVPALMALSMLTDGFCAHSAMSVEIGASYRNAHAGYRSPSKPVFQTIPAVGLSWRKWGPNANATTIGVTGGLAVSGALPRSAEMMVTSSADMSRFDATWVKADRLKKRPAAITN